MNLRFPIIHRFSQISGNRSHVLLRPYQQKAISYRFLSFSCFFFSSFCFFQYLPKRVQFFRHMIFLAVTEPVTLCTPYSRPTATEASLPALWNLRYWSLVSCEADSSRMFVGDYHQSEFYLGIQYPSYAWWLSHTLAGPRVSARGVSASRVFFLREKKKEKTRDRIIHSDMIVILIFRPPSHPPSPGGAVPSAVNCLRDAESYSRLPRSLLKV